MFTPTNLFKGIPCPQGGDCELLNCIFNHDALSASDGNVDSDRSTIPLQSQTTTPTMQLGDRSAEPPFKRRKLQVEQIKDKPLSRAEQIRASIANERKNQGQAACETKVSKATSIASLHRPITPPNSSTASSSVAPPRDGGIDWLETPLAKIRAASQTNPERLNPRVMNPAPDSHAKRVLYLQHIHSNMVRLNNELKAASQPTDGLDPVAMQNLVLTDQEIIMLALNEEETIGKGKSRIYPNSIRNCVASYQKMTLSAWLDKLRSLMTTDRDVSLINRRSKAANTSSNAIPPGQEHLLLPHLIVREQDSLRQFGYITSPPSEADAKVAAEAVELSGNHEQCDRCGSRFRVFPDRDPTTGCLTSNGPCRYHWARKTSPSKQKTDNYTGANDAIYPCCGQSLGTEGCTKHDDHVYKTNAPSRLAAVLPFLSTSRVESSMDKPDGKHVQAVVFDCEMGYTTNGLELLRLTALEWPQGEVLVDVLVRPLGTIIDLNTRFSGIKPGHMTNAVPYVEGGSVVSEPGRMIIVDGPATARKLLCSFLTPDTPLMGHAIDNDLNATRLCHASIIDTVLLYSHPRGLPFRYGLKMLSKKYLGRDIQIAESAGHDSREDARATGDLIKVKANEVWADLASRGWTMNAKGLTRPATDNSEIGWQMAAKKSKPKSAGQSNGLAKIIDDARSASAQSEAVLTGEILES